jgi:hypothetical protein
MRSCFTKSTKKKRDDLEEALDSYQTRKTVAVLGFTGVGKSPLIRHLTGQQLISNEKASAAWCTYEPPNQESAFSFLFMEPQLSDVTRVDRLPWFQSVNLCIVVFDVSDKTSLTDIEHVQWGWSVLGLTSIPILAVGLHIEEERREISKEDIARWRREKNIPTFEFPILNESGRLLLLSKMEVLLRQAEGGFPVRLKRSLSDSSIEPAGSSTTTASITTVNATQSSSRGSEYEISPNQ